MRGVPGGAVLLAGAEGGGVRATRVALFDIDGTLFDSERLWAEALALAFEELGERQPADRLMAQIYGMAWPDAAATLGRLYPRAMGQTSGLALGRRMCVIFERLFAAAPPVIEPAARLLRRLRAAGVPCGYVSGSPRVTIERDLRAAGLDGLLDLGRSVPSDDAPRGKPFPDGYRLALERFGVAAGEAVVFEDSRVGATAALAAGVGEVCVCPPPSAPPQTYPEGVRRLASWDDFRVG